MDIRFSLGTASCIIKTMGMCNDKPATLQLDHAYALSSNVVNHSLEDTRVSTMESLNDDLMDLGFDALLNGILIL